MADLLEIVQYERDHAVKLVDPISKEDLGVTIWVKHADCQAATRVAEDHEIAIALGGKRTGEMQMKIFAACISKWDFGEFDVDGVKGGPELTQENALDVLRKAPWIISQISPEIYRMANFTKN